MCIHSVRFGKKIMTLEHHSSTFVITILNNGKLYKMYREMFTYKEAKARYDRLIPKLIEKEYM